MRKLNKKPRKKNMSTHQMCSSLTVSRTESATKCRARLQVATKRSHTRGFKAFLASAYYHTLESACYHLVFYIDAS